MLFTDFFLHERVFKSLENTPFKTPTPVQSEAIPLALEEKDLVVSAKTGSGKTAAFLLPTISRLLSNPKKNAGTRVIILVPTRELANQVIKEVEIFGKFTFFKFLSLTGGASYQEQGAMLRKDPEIVVATPGRLSEHLEKGSLDLDDLDVLILDEADRMLDLGFGDEVTNIIKFCPKERQTLLFSATLNQKGLKEIISALMDSPDYVTVDRAQDQHSNITQQSILSDDDKLKQKQTDWLLENEDFDKAIVFTNTKTKANQLNSYLCYRRHKAGVLEGDMMQDERNHIMSRFKQGHIKVLVATDVAARGLDIQGIDLVINFDVPRSGDDYVHRIGRTGRAGELGTAVTFICQSEFNLMASIERYLKVSTERRVIESLQSSFKEPKKLRGDGRAFGKKKPKKGDKKGKKKAAKGKASAKRNAKRPAAKSSTVISDGHMPLKRK